MKPVLTLPRTTATVPAAPTTTTEPNLAPGPSIDPHPMERWIGLVLLGGVCLAAAIILFGVIRLWIVGFPTGVPVSVDALIKQETHPTSLAAILDGVSEGRPTSIVRLGVIVLILTPVARVALTLVLFIMQRDKAFILLTALVLLILVLGLTGVIG